MTAPRRIVANQTYFITRRCSRREYLLRPDEETNAVLAYCLAEAAARHDIGLIAWNVMSNHYHAVVHDPNGRLPAFLEHFHKMVAKTMNARWGRSENFWSSEETCAARLISNNDIFEKVIYTLCNPVAADLVDRVHDWPGLSSLGYMSGKVTKHRRPMFYFCDVGVMPASASLRSTLPSRITKNESAASWWQRVREAVGEREQTLRDERQRKKRRVLGRKAVMRMPHTDSPKVEVKKRNLRPHLACKDADRRILEIEALKAFRAAYRVAREALANGVRRVVFPFGTYRLLAFGIRCAGPPSLA